MLMTITPDTPDVALPIAAYLRRHYPFCRHWPREILLGWVRWHLGENFLAYVLDGEKDGCGRIVGVGVARPVMQPADGLVDYRFDHEGPVLFVDVTVATAPHAMLMLLAMLRRRFGFRPTLAYERRERVVIRSFLGLHRKLFTKARTVQLSRSHV